MNKHLSAIFCMVIAIGIALTGCSNLPESQDPSSSVNNAMSSQVNQAADGENSPTELVVQFGEGGTPFMKRLENNSTAEAIAGYVGTTSWQLPIYHFDESDVMQYYDIASRYEIPDNSQTVTEAHAGDVFYSDPNRIVLYYHDAGVNEKYTKIGTFEATEEFVTAVEENPVLEGWGNKLVFISIEE